MGVSLLYRPGLPPIRFQVRIIRLKKANRS